MTDLPIEATPPPAWWRLGPALWIAWAFALLATYLVFNLPGGWFGGGTAKTYPGSAVAIATGFGQAEGEKLVITRPDSKNATILALLTPRISTLEFGLVTFDVDGMPDDAEVTMFWRNDLAPAKMFTRNITVAGGRVQDAMVAGDSNWLGRINTVGLIIRGPLKQPLTVQRVTLSPATAGTVLMERWRDWFDRESWTGISLSRVIGGRPGMNLPLTLLAALAVMFAILTYWGLQRWRGWMFSPLTIAAIVATGWLAVDLRWQWNLLANAVISVGKYAGKDLSEKRLAGVDAELEGIAIDLRPLIPKDARLFVVAPDPVTAGRLAYLLLPARVHYDIAVNTLPLPEHLKTGDLVLIHRKVGIRYSPERKEFLWDERFHLKADILFLRQGTLLARVS
ncbi:MAG: hypothetical protein ABJB04_04030 [Betaproteobacteria bacterium]